MPHHRLCVLNEHGQFMGAVNLACIDDDAAKEHANRLALGHRWSFGGLLRGSNSGRPSEKAPSRPRGHVLAISTSRLSDRTSLGCGCSFWRCSMQARLRCS